MDVQVKIKTDVETLSVSAAEPTKHRKLGGGHEVGWGLGGFHFMI